MKTKGKINATRRRIGKALRYLAATVTTAIGFYVLFSLLFSTEEEKRLQQENDLYATYYQELREKERLVTDVVEGLEVRDDALYRRIFETEAPSVDAVTAADMISVSDSLSESFYLSYSASKSESLRMMAQNVKENFREIYRLMAARKDSIPPLTMPIEGMSYVQTGASVGLKHNPLYKVDIRHEGLDLIAPQGSVVKAAADGLGKNFGDVKVAFDVFCVALALVLSLLFFHTVVGTREGTVISALCTGLVVKFFTGRLYKPVTRFLTGGKSDFIL